MQWVFDCCEDDLEDYYWKYSYYELKKRIELKVGYTTASHMSIYSAFIEVASAALGGEKKANPITEDLSNATPDQFIARVAQLASM